MDCTALRRRYFAAKDDRTNVESVWERIERFVVPFRAQFYEVPADEGTVDWRRRDIYDSTAVIANGNLASNIHSGLTNSSVRWFDFVLRDRTLSRQMEVKKWLDDCANTVFLALQESNFNLEINETYIDLTSFGSAALVEEVLEDGRGNLQEIDFSATPLGECYFEEDHKGRIQYFYRRYYWTALQIYTKFGEDGTPEHIKQQMDNAEESKKRHECVFAIYPRVQYKNGDRSRFIPKLKRPFGYKYFLVKDAVQLGKEGGYYEMPVFFPRWRKTSGSKWGHSPAMICLSDILTLNQLVELITKAATKVIDPPIMVKRRGIFSDIDLKTGGMTVVLDMDSMKPFESGARFDVSALTKEELQKSVQSAFFMDQLQLKESPAMTATEVQVRYELMQRLLGPTLSRLTFDLLDPLVKRTFWILFRYEQLPPAPRIIQQQGGELDIQYVGPMARAQKMDTAASVERWLGGVQNMAQTWPQVLDIPNPDEIAKGSAELLSVPPRYVHGDAKVTSIRTARKQEQEQMKQAQAVQQGGEAAKSLGEGAAALKEVMPDAVEQLSRGIATGANPGNGNGGPPQQGA